MVNYDLYFTSCFFNKQCDLMREFLVGFLTSSACCVCVLQDPSDHHHELLPWQAFGEWRRSVKGPARQSSLHQPRCPKWWESSFSLCVCLCVWLTWLTLHVTTVIKAHKPNHLHGPNQDSSRKPSAWMSNSYVYWSHYLCCVPQDLTC